jgi:hypothetical protein
VTPTTLIRLQHLVSTSHKLGSLGRNDVDVLSLNRFQEADTGSGAPAANAKGRLEVLDQLGLLVELLLRDFEDQLARVILDFGVLPQEPFEVRVVDLGDDFGAVLRP